MSSTSSRRPSQLIYVQCTGSYLDRGHGIDFFLFFGSRMDHEACESLRNPVSDAVDKVGRSRRHLSSFDR